MSSESFLRAGELGLSSRPVFSNGDVLNDSNLDRGEGCDDFSEDSVIPVSGAVIFWDNFREKLGVGGKKEVLLTGDRPTGSLHLGHYVGSLKMRVELQDFFDLFILIADVQALTDNFENPALVRKNVLEVFLDYLSVGIDPSKSTIFIQSQIPEIAELTVFFMNLVTVNRLKRNPTVKSEISQKSFSTVLPLGFLAYPVSQSADIATFLTNYVPAGLDQVPMIEQTVEIVRRFNSLYEKIFPEPKIIVPSRSGWGRLPGIDGKCKMSKSQGNAIYLKDDPDEIKRKVMMMFTDPNHLRISDPGRVEGNMVFTYLDIFYDDKKRLEELKAHYRAGGLGEVKLKLLLNDLLQEFLAPIRKRRMEFEKEKGELWSLLRRGTEEARQRAEKTMKAVKNAMRIAYFQ